MYKCDKMASSCGECLTQNEAYSCGWCNTSNQCSLESSCTTRNGWFPNTKICPNPTITRVSNKNATFDKTKLYNHNNRITRYKHWRTTCIWLSSTIPESWPTLDVQKEVTLNTENCYNSKIARMSYANI